MSKRPRKTSEVKAATSSTAARFDLDDPNLPAWVEDGALTSGDYPYSKKLAKDDYEHELRLLQIELLKLQSWARDSGERIVILVEGRDAAGKGSTIKRVMQHLNPRHAAAVALAKPTETERGQWYFQRYLAHLPTAGDMSIFERSWYNRAGVERVMGFCTPEESQKFLREAPQVEAALLRDGVRFFKFWLTIGRETQLKRFHARRHDPLKVWKLSEIDIAAIGKWDAYSAAAEDMFAQTHTADSPWTVVRANDKRRTRLNVMRAVLTNIAYAQKDAAAVGEPDSLIVGAGRAFFDIPPG